MTDPDFTGTERARLRAELPYYKAPEELRLRVQALAAGAPSGPDAARRPARAWWKTGTEQWRWIGWGALSGCAATLLATWIVSGVIDWRAGRDIALQAVADHVDASRADRLIVIASSDQHTVKPWLSAHLDYSPPVPDLAAEGFPLIGGRLETLRGRQVATLVYHYHQHTIDVFVRPLPVTGIPEARDMRGFHIAHAQSAGMDWIGVSDVSPDVLNGFVERLARSDPAKD
jgi:anti-sigma factor RsiW